MLHNAKLKRRCGQTAGLDQQQVNKASESFKAKIPQWMFKRC